MISLKKLIVREVAHEEKGLFLISMGVRDPEMVEVHASSREERNSWIQIIQDTINTLYVKHQGPPFPALLTPPCDFIIDWTVAREIDLLGIFVLFWLY